MSVAGSEPSEEFARLRPNPAPERAPKNRCVNFQRANQGAAPTPGRTPHGRTYVPGPPHPAATVVVNQTRAPGDRTQTSARPSCSTLFTDRRQQTRPRRVNARNCSTSRPGKHGPSYTQGAARHMPPLPQQELPLQRTSWGRSPQLLAHCFCLQATTLDTRDSGSPQQQRGLPR